MLWLFVIFESFRFTEAVVVVVVSGDGDCDAVVMVLCNSSSK